MPSINFTKNFKNYPFQTKVRVINNSSGHGSRRGTILTIKSPYNINQGYYVNENTYWYDNSDLEPVELDNSHLQKLLADYEKEFEKVAHEIEMTKAKIDFLKETGQKTFDEQEFKVYQTLKLMQDPSICNLLDRAKEIVKIFA